MYEGKRSLRYTPCSTDIVRLLPGALPSMALLLWFEILPAEPVEYESRTSPEPCAKDHDTAGRRRGRLNNPNLAIHLVSKRLTAQLSDGFHNSVGDA